MSDHYFRNVIEGALLAAGRPLTVGEIAQLFEESGRPGPAQVREALERLAEDYTGRAIELKETASGFRIQVRQDYAQEVGRLWPERAQRYSRALLETLALIAYRQPITRAEIESVRGVAVNPNILKTLIERNWVRALGHRDVPGHPELLGTTREFLDYFGLKRLDELPPLAELKAMADINPQLTLPGTGEVGAGDDVALVNVDVPVGEDVASDPAPASETEHGVEIDGTARIEGHAESEGNTETAGISP